MTEMGSFKDAGDKLINRFENSFLGKKAEKVDFRLDDYDVPLAKELNKEMKIEKATMLPRNGGEWLGEPGTSEWKPNPEIKPGDRNGTNPEHKTWAEIMKQYDIESIPFDEGEPDFSEVAKGEVQIDDFSDDRGSNFDQADEKLAEQRGCTPEEVAKWRADYRYTWHERKDCKTMQKVPSEVHGNISHSGGISEYKAKNQDA